MYFERFNAEYALPSYHEYQLNDISLTQNFKSRHLYDYLPITTLCYKLIATEQNIVSNSNTLCI